MFAVGIDSHITLVFGSARNLYNTNTFCFAESPGCFQLLQTIQTHYGMAVTSFQLKDALLIAFASYQEGKFFYRTKLPVYVLQQNTFTLNQTLDSFGARDVEYFTINFQHFLVMATEYDGHSYKQDSVCTNCRPFKLCFTIHVFPIQWFNLRTKGRSRYGEPCLRGYSQHLHGRF